MVMVISLALESTVFKRSIFDGLLSSVVYARSLGFEAAASNPTPSSFSFQPRFFIFFPETFLFVKVFMLTVGSFFVFYQ